MSGQGFVYSQPPENRMFSDTIQFVDNNSYLLVSEQSYGDVTKFVRLAEVTWENIVPFGNLAENSVAGGCCLCQVIARARDKGR